MDDKKKETRCNQVPRQFLAENLAVEPRTQRENCERRHSQHECRAFARRTDQTELEDQILYPRFTIDQCILLLTILDYVGWTIGRRLGHGNGKPDRMDISKRQWYHVLNFSEETILPCVLTDV